MMFKTRYNARVPSKGTLNEKDSLTLQSEYPMTTIDYYLKRYSATGQLGDPVRAQAATFDDVSDVEDFQEMQNQVVAVKEAFGALPAEERRLYGDDPANWINAKIAEKQEEMQKAMQAAQAKQAAQAAKDAASSEKPAGQASQESNPGAMPS